MNNDDLNKMLFDEAKERIARQKASQDLFDRALFGDLPKDKHAIDLDPTISLPAINEFQLQDCKVSLGQQSKWEFGMKIRTTLVWMVIAVAVLVSVKMLVGARTRGAAHIVDEDLKYAVCDDNSVVVTGSCPATVTGNYVIPPMLDGKVVTGIGCNAFACCRGLTRVAIPESVTSIGRGAFERCTSLKSVEIPEGVTNISHAAFAFCESLESVVMPMSVEEFGVFVFRFCRSLKSVKIGNDVFEFYKPLKDTADGFKKAKEELRAAECEKLALEKLRCTTDGEYVWEVCVQRNNCRSRHEGIENFVANFEYAVPPLSDNMTYVNGELVRREELYAAYLNAGEAVSKRTFGLKEKDEFETDDEYEIRRRNEEKSAMDLQGARDKALDEIVAYEKEHNPKVFRCSVNDFFVMKEALVFIPKTEWKYEANERQFGVKGREFNSDFVSGLSEYMPAGGRCETVQGFRFSVNSLPIIQFVKSGSINYKYKVPDDVWKHPRMFKEYKQQHPFLLVHLGLCDFKVRGFQDQVVTMPWSHENTKKGSSNDGITQMNQKGRSPNRIAGGEISSWRRSALAKLNEDSWCKQQAMLDAQKKLKREGKKQITKDRGEDILCKILSDAEVRTNYDPRMDGELLFKVCTNDAKEDGTLVAMGIYADYKTPEGRAEIENVLNHFEETGGAYYRGFAKAVRRVMELESSDVGPERNKILRTGM